MKYKKHNNILGTFILNKLQLILRMGRIHFLTFGFLLYLLGFFIALLNNNNLDITKFIFGYLPFSFAHLSVSYSNDYFDQKTDKTSNKTMFSGGSCVLVEHPELQKTALKISVMLIALSITSSIAFTLAFNYPYWLILFVTTGALVGWFYSAPPLKLSYRGYGEIATMIAVGLLMPGMGYFIAAGTITLQILLFTIPLLFYGLFFIITVELPDLENDKASNKKTLVVRLGRQKAKLTLIAISITGAAFITALNLFDPLKFSLIPSAIISTIPILSASIGYFTKTENRQTIVKQVTTNMASLIILIIVMNLNLLAHYLSMQLTFT